MVASRQKGQVSSSRLFLGLFSCVVAVVALKHLSLLNVSAIAATPSPVGSPPATTGPVTAMALSRDGKSIVVATHSGIEIGELQDSTKWIQHAFEADQISDLEFSPDGTLLVVAGGTPGQFGLTEILKWPTCERYALYRDFDEVCTAAAWSPDGRHVAVGCHDSTIQIFSVESGKMEAKVESHSRAVTGLVWTTTDNKPETGTVLVSSSLDQSVRLFVPIITEDDMTIIQTRILDQHTREVQGIALASVQSRFQNEKLTLVSWGDDRTLRFWQPLTGRMLRFAKLESEVVDAVWDAHGTIVIAALSNGEVVTVDLQDTHIHRLQRFDPPITKVSVSPGNRELIVSDSRGRVHFVPYPQTIPKD